MARLAITLLGSFHVARDGHPTGSLGYDKVRALLAYLVVERRQPHARATLATLLWPDVAEGVARKSLRNALATLRQAIGDTTADPPCLLITRDTVQCNPAANVQVDVALFDAHILTCAQHPHSDGGLCGACVDHLQQAVALYHGDFLSRVVVPNSLAWDEWVLLRRERLHCQMLDALTQLATYYERQGEILAIRQYARQALVLEPWNESMHRCLMRSYARSGQHGAALAQYQRCHHVLAEELGMEPAAETTVLYEQIRTRKISAGYRAETRV